MAPTLSRHSKDAGEAAVDCELGGVTRTRRIDELWERWDRHMGAQVDTGRADVLMILCALVAGLIDSTVFNAFRTFVSMQTGTYYHLLSGSFFVSVINRSSTRQHHLCRSRGFFQR